MLLLNMLSGRIESIHREFPRLKDNSIGDSAQREISIYQPPKQLTKSQNRLQSVYVLPGWGSRASKYLQNTQVFGESFLSLIERAMLESKLPPLILVFLDGASRFGCHQYIDSAALGPNQTWIADDVTALVEERAPASPEPEDRIIYGHSSGGFGALWMGFQRPDRFRKIVCSAADSFFELSILKEVPGACAELEKAGGVEAFLEEFLKHPMPSALGSRSFLTMLLLSLAPCYAARPKTLPLHGEVFFDIKTGKIKQDIWEEYLKWDPARAVDLQDHSKLKQSYFVLDCGLQDEFAAQLGHRQIAESLQKHALPHRLEEFHGRHSGNDWRVIQRLQWALRECR
ncbi:MAG: alpha/beta hydrolase [Bradymonadales bacterium]|nr:MAG: alpha/beta hydrolase [Bradymonadales bacterium]